MKDVLSTSQMELETQWPSQSRQIQIQKRCSEVKNSEVNKNVLSQSNDLPFKFFFMNCCVREYFLLKRVGKLWSLLYGKEHN